MRIVRITAALTCLGVAAAAAAPVGGAALSTTAAAAAASKAFRYKGKLKPTVTSDSIIFKGPIKGTPFGAGTIRVVNHLTGLDVKYTWVLRLKDGVIRGSGSGRGTRNPPAITFNGNWKITSGTGKFRKTRGSGKARADIPKGPAGPVYYSLIGTVR